MVTVTKYVWDPVFDCVSHELDENNAVKAVYNNEPQQYGGVLSQRRGTTSHYHHHDALGSTRFLSDSSSNVTDTYLHDAWGNSIASTGTTVNPFRWIGKHGYCTDNSTGQVCVRARIYQPNVARWCSFDPIGFRDGLNRFRYAQSDPAYLVDKSGLICTPCCCCAEGIGIAFSIDLDPPTIKENGVGTYFQLLVDLQLRPSAISGPCKLEYWEWSTPNAGERRPSNCWKDNYEGEQEKTDKRTVAWCDLSKPGDARPTGADWCEFVHPSEFSKKKCPSTYRIPLQDTPTIRKEANNLRNLYFHVVVKSNPECKCWNEEVVWEGCQFLELDAAGNVVKKEFHASASGCANFPEFTEENKCRKTGR